MAVPLHPTQKATIPSYQYVNKDLWSITLNELNEKTCMNEPVGIRLRLVFKFPEVSSFLRSSGFFSKFVVIVTLRRDFMIF